MIFHAKMKQLKAGGWCMFLAFLLSAVMIINRSDDISENIVLILGVLLPVVMLRGKIVKWLSIYPVVVILSSVMSVFASFAMALLMRRTDMEIITDEVTILIGEAFPAVVMLLICIYYKYKKKNFIEITFRKPQYALLYVGVFFALAVSGFSQGLSSEDMLTLQQRNVYGLAITGISLAFIIFGLWNGIILHKQGEDEREIKRLHTYMIMQEKHFETVIQGDKKLRAYRHDMRGHLIALKSLCDRETHEELKQYIETILKESEVFQSARYTGNTAVDAVLHDLKETAEKHQIQVTYKCVIQNELFINLFDLCTVISNLLNNAIEACEKNRDNKQIILKMYPYNEHICLVTENPSEKPVHIKKQVLVTTKGDMVNHGLGSRNIKYVVDKYGGSVDYQYIDGWFKAEIIL